MLWWKDGKGERVTYQGLGRTATVREADHCRYAAHVFHALWLEWRRTHWSFAMAPQHSPSTIGFTRTFRVWPWLVAVAVLAGTVALLRWEGRIWWCACGQWSFWTGNVWSPHCSQHFFDPYSLTHISHGLIFYGLLAQLGRGPFRLRLSLPWRFSIALAAAALWEVVENSAAVVERYRAATMSQNYLGDSVANALGDIASCALGFFVARQLGWRGSVLLFLALEGVLLLWIRDNLTLNVVMLLWPVESIKAWQAAGQAVG
jgi:hypothetical protein